MSDDKPTAAAPEKNIETVVIAEDSVPNQKILQHLLIKLGYEVAAAKNGSEAWTLINGGQFKNIVCVISDLMMPEENGLTLLKRLRDSSQFKALPFVFVTAVADKELIKEAKGLGISGYILKPVSFTKVEAKMKELFPGRKFPKVAA